MKKVFAFCLGIFLALVFSLLLVNFILMPILTKRQKVVIMPEVVGLTENEAEDLLRKAGLEIGEKRWAFSLQYPEGRIIAQEPRANVKVKKKRIVELTLSKGRGKTVVPDFSGRGLSEFLEMLMRADLSAKVETVYGEEEGGVKTCIPSPGTLLEKGSVVRVLVNQKEGFVLMPRLVGLKLEEAKRVLDSLHLVLDEVREKESEEEAGTIIFQYPEEEMRIRIGGRVVLVQAKGGVK
ncbi:MAG: PASTA domain-containing protein [candidate division WOR-3 bacterium]